MAAPVLKGPVSVRTVMNGFIAVYQSQEYVFLTSQTLNAWMTTISIGG